MLHLLRRLWTKAIARRAVAASEPNRCARLHVEPLETRSMLSAMPLDLDASYQLAVDREVDGPTVLPQQRTVAIDRPIVGGGFGKFTFNPTQAGRVISLWPNVKFLTNLRDQISIGSDEGGFVTNSWPGAVNSTAQAGPPQAQQPAIEQEILDVREVLAGLSFAADAGQAPEAILSAPSSMVSPRVEVVTPKTEVAPPKFESVTSKPPLAAPKIEVAAPKLEQAEPLTSPVQREKTTNEPESSASRAPGASQPLVQFVDDAEGGMVTLGYHKVADQSAMLTATSAANVHSILDRAVQFDRAYGTFQAFEVSSGEAAVQTPTPTPATNSPAAKPVGTTSEQHNRPASEEAKPAIGAISFLPALDALTINLGANVSSVIGKASVRLEEACVDAVFEMAATEEQYEQTIGNSSLIQVIAAVAVAAVFHQAQVARAAEPDKAAAGLSAKTMAK